MRRRNILGAMAGAVIALAGTTGAVSADPSSDDDPTATMPIGPPAPPDTTVAGPPAPVDPPVAADPPSPVVSAPVAPARPVPVATRVVSSKPDPSDPHYSANAYPPRKETMDGPPVPGDIALVSDDLNLRENGDYTSKVQVVMPAGSLVTIEKRLKDGFYLVNYQSSLGWAAAHARMASPVGRTQLQPGSENA